jgi:hypothetical protein
LHRVPGFAYFSTGIAGMQWDRFAQRLRDANYYGII